MAKAIPARLEVWDYVSLSSVVILSSLVGFYHVYTARKTKTTQEFLVTSRELGIFPLIISTVATFYSAIGMLGLPLETYVNGPSFMIISLTMIIQIPIAIFLFLPVFFKLNKISIFEYLELRFNPTVRVMASIMITLQTVFYTACVIYAPALALNQVTGIHFWTSVVCVGIACILYTSMGGIKAVVWADVTQCTVMIGILSIIIVKSVIDIGGFGVIADRLISGNRTELFIWTSSPNSKYSVWTMVIGCPIHYISNLVINQAFMQRYLSSKSLKSAQIQYTGAGFATAIGQIIMPGCGLLIYSHYFKCDPILTGEIVKGDQLMALFAMETLSFCKGLPGVFVAGILCATLSTLSSTLNSLTAVTLSDYIKPFKPDLSDAASMKLSKLLAVFYGVLCVALVAVAERLGGVLQAVYSIYGLTGGPVLTLFTIGMLIPKATSKGAVTSFLISMIIPWWAWFGSLLTSPPVNHAPYSVEGCSNFTVNTVNVTFTQHLNYQGIGLLQQFYTISSFWYALWSVVIGLTSAIIITKFISSQDPALVDSGLIFPFMRKFLPDTKSPKVYYNEPNAEDVIQVIHPLLDDKPNNN